MLEGWGKGGSVFIHEERLLLDYIPSQLPHREEQLKLLASMFKSLIRSPGSVSQKVILTGPIGTGKTVVAKYFGLMTEREGEAAGVRIRYVHVNCHKDRTLFLVMRKTARELKLPVPPRGFSSQELIGITWNMLEDRDEYLLLTLDEADYLLKTNGSDALYILSRISDEYVSSKQRISLILIMRDLTALYLMDRSAKSSLLHNVIKFEPYTSVQIRDILSERVFEEKAMRPEAVDEGVLDYIGELVGVDKQGPGDARMALEILWRAGKYAEGEGRGRVAINDVRRAFNDIVFISPIESLDNLKLHEAILFLAIIKLLRRGEGKGNVTLGEVEEAYKILCEELNERPRGHTKVWEYTQNLKNMGLISARLSGKGQRGKTTLIDVPIGSLEVLEKEVSKSILRRLRELG